MNNLGYSSLLSWMPFILSALITLFIIGVGVGIYSWRSSKHKDQKEYNRQLLDILDEDQSELGVKKAPKITLVSRWNSYWGRIFKLLKISKYEDSDKDAGRNMFILFAVVIIVSSIIFRNIFLGIIMPIVIIFIVNSLLKMRANKEENKLNEELPGFLFAFKANLQGNETPERAIQKIVDDMPSPLREDLMVAKQKLLSGGDLKEALRDCSRHTASRDLQFLCACLIQAAGTGTNLEDQITVIQGVLDSRREVSSELAKAVSSATPAIWVASIIIPVMFVSTIVLNPESQKFWFHGVFSWVCFILVVVIYGIGIYFSKRLVDNIKNL